MLVLLAIFVMCLMVLFFIIMHLHIASHLGTLDEPRGGREVGTEPEDGVWWTFPEDGRIPGVHARTGDAHQASVI